MKQLSGRQFLAGFRDQNTLFERFLMKTPVFLPSHLRIKIDAFPEDFLGAHQVAVVLKDGRTIKNVIVAWAREIVCVGGKKRVPFDPDDVVDVISEPDLTWFKK